MLKKDRITLLAVVQHAVEISSSGMEAKGHRLDLDMPAADYTLDADHARLVQSLANLLVNAAKFTPANGRIALGTSVDGDTVTFRVRDNGIGMEQASLARVFELFAQTPVPGEAPTGLGIGLSLARQFAEMHGGSLSAQSEGLGLGSEFVLTLPVVTGPVEGSEGADRGADTGADAEAQVRQSPAPAAPPAVAGRRRRLLLVDDNVDAADTLVELLGMDGFEVSVAYDGVAAVDAVRKAMPDAVVMDIGMPGMNGYEAAQLIRQMSGAEHITLVALTGWGQGSDRKRASEAGFDHHLVKPVDYDMLLKCLQA